MHVLFLPGAAGAGEFWHPLGACLPAEWEKTYLSWPGLGSQPHDPKISGFDNFVELAEKRMRGKTAIVAQSMGGVVGVRLALKHPDKISHLILFVTSGGVDVSRFGAYDWREDYQRNFPNAASWILTDRPDHTAEIRKVCCPTLLFWGDSDPISPVAVGEYLASLIQGSVLRVVKSGEHDLGRARASEVAPWVISHLQSSRDE